MSLEDRLQAALEVRAAGTRTSPDALVTIRGRVRRSSRRRRGVLAGASALAVAVVAGAAAVALGSGPSVGTVATSSTPSSLTPSSAPVSPPPTSDSGPAPSARPSDRGLSSEPVYLVASTSDGDRLYREYHQLPGGELTERIAAAITEMIDKAPLDPDYRTGWPSGAGVRSVSIEAGVVVVDLTVPPTPPADPDLAVQQLIYTVTAVAAQAGRRDLTQVRLVGDLGWGLDTSEPLPRAAHLDVLAPVWLASPQEGAVVGRTFTVEVQGTVFEAAAVLRVRDGAGAVFDERPVQLSAGPPSRGLASLELTLPPGLYTLEAFYRSPNDGSEQAIDDHAITVR